MKAKNPLGKNVPIPALKSFQSASQRRAAFEAATRFDAQKDSRRPEAV